MIRPDDDTAPFVSRWNTLIRVLLVESSVKLVARTAMDYADFNTGANCHPSNDRLARDTGYSERTIRDAWSVLRGLDLAERVATAVAHARLADEYQLVIPGDWRGLPTIGPRGRKFTCLGCGKGFNPAAHQAKRKPDGQVRFDVSRFCFCAAARGEHTSHCLRLWDLQRKQRGEKPWRDTADKWALFRQARGDDW